MTKFNFGRATDDTLNVRMSKRTAEQIRKIAKAEDISVQEVCRTFLEVALKDYLAERAADTASAGQRRVYE